MSDSDPVAQRWLEFIRRLRRYSGMWLISGSLIEASALLAGFDAGMRTRRLVGFQEWLSARHPEASSVYFPWHIVHELTADHETDRDPRRLSDAENAAAVLVLLDLVERYFTKQSSDAPNAGDGT
jgi:hypothetical protein